ncbi:MAG: GNAT family N-acetyltransferase [Desulfohalobiaceae bacterium]|nr:GNAT family N-acetyltransferase [Desulfohalobiaceae bacterium]
MSYIHPDNAASCALAERLGARLIKRSSLYGLDRLVYQHPGPSAA